jgi:hypothetical protein
LPYGARRAQTRRHDRTVLTSRHADRPVAALALAAPSPAAAAPPNDHLADAARVPGLSDVKSGYTTVGATREAGEAQHYGSWPATRSG